MEEEGHRISDWYCERRVGGERRECNMASDVDGMGWDEKCEAGSDRMSLRAGECPGRLNDRPRFFCSAFIDYVKGRFEAIKDIYSPYQIKLRLSSLCCVIVPLNSLHHTNSFSLDHDWSWWQRYGNTSFFPSLSFCVSSCIPSVISFHLLHFSFNVSPYRFLLHHLPNLAFSDSIRWVRMW